MSKFDLFASDNDTEESGDVMPSAGFGPLDTGLYKMAIVLAYLSESKNGAHGLNLHLKKADGTGSEIRQTLWMTSGKAKGQRNSYVDKNGVKHKLPGMEMADNLHALIDGKEMVNADSEEKVVKLWNTTEGKEVNTTVSIITSLMNKPVLVGLHKCRDNKNVLKDGKYVPTSKERWSNEINKFFDPDTGMTYTEKKAKATEPVWLEKWKTSFDATYVRDRYEQVADEIADDFASAGGGQTKALFP